MAEDIQDFFICDNCAGRDFSLVYNFSIRFHGVNFSDELIYDKLVEEIYQCTRCLKTFTKQDIEAGLARIKNAHKSV